MFLAAPMSITVLAALLAFHSLATLYLAITTARMGRQVEVAHQALHHHWRWIREAERRLGNVERLPLPPPAHQSRESTPGG